MDLRDAIEQEGDTQKLQTVVSSQEAKKWALDYNFQGYIECSAKEKKNLDDVFMTAYRSHFEYQQLLK